MRYLFFLPGLFFLTTIHIHAQDSATTYTQDSATLISHINALCSRGLMGRGYVGKGMQKAARYVAQQYKDAGLKPIGNDYTQSYHYPVNTFPSVVNIIVDDRALQAGADYLVHPASNGFSEEELKLKVVDGKEFLKRITSGKKDTMAEWQRWSRKKFKKKTAFLLNDADTLKKVLQWHKYKDLYRNLPQGIFFITRKDKPIWSVAKEVMPATVIEVYDSTLSLNKKSKITATVINQYADKYAAENVIGYVPGTAFPDSFIVFSAHYDHLGKMGSRAMFPGASDNASGTAMLLTLAKYYAEHPQKYSVAFMAFSGEEAGLMGSNYYTEHPLFPLEKIRFLVNLDIMGDATDGISVINGELHKREADLLLQLNKESNLLPDIRLGGKAANSDHYPFSEKGVPAFFIFTRGGKGYYHDIWDKPEHVTLKNVPAVAALIRQFVSAL